MWFGMGRVVDSRLHRFRGDFTDGDTGATDRSQENIDLCLTKDRPLSPRDSLPAGEKFDRLVDLLGIGTDTVGLLGPRGMAR